MTPDDLRGRSTQELHELLVAGEPVDTDALTERVFHGTSLGLPRLVERLTWTTFIKAFHLDPELGELRGWNVRTVQPGWTPQVRRGVERSFGHFLVRPASESPAGSLAPQGLVLDYGAFYAPWQPLGRMRDPLVTLPDSDGLLLGTTLVALGTRFATPAYFCLAPGPALQSPVPAPRLRARC